LFNIIKLRIKRVNINLFKTSWPSLLFRKLKIPTLPILWFTLFSSRHLVFGFQCNGVQNLKTFTSNLEPQNTCAVNTTVKCEFRKMLSSCTLTWWYVRTVKTTWSLNLSLFRLHVDQSVSQVRTRSIKLYHSHPARRFPRD